MRFSLLLILLFIFSSICFAQIQHGGSPVSSEVRLPGNIEYLSFNKINGDQQSFPKVNAQPLYAGYTLPVVRQPKLNWEEAGQWGFVSRCGFTVKDAFALNLYFSDLNLDVGESLFVYTKNKKQILGSFNSSNNSTFFATAFLRSDSIVLEYFARERKAKFPFLITEIGIQVNEAPDQQRDFGDAGSCEILVNCPEGDDWQKEKNGITRILVKESNSLYWCTGSLINNTAQDGTPYLLTANHCGIGSSENDYLQWVFYFKYESPNCEFPANEPELLSMTGATRLAHAQEPTDSDSDFKLLLLNEPVPQNYEPYFNGWNRSGLVSLSGVGIHHPEGDLKMISTYVDALRSTHYLGEEHDPTGNYWMVNWAPTDGGHGVTEGGSSGSPLFNGEGQIVGALTGGRASCNYPDEADYYGKFSVSWYKSGADSSSQLAVWLDPINSNVLSLNGTDLDSANLEALFRANYTNILLGETATFINSSTGNISAYEWYFPNGFPDYSEARDPGPVQYTAAGSYDIELVVRNAEGMDKLVRQNYIHVMPSIFPNPTSSGLVTLNFGNQIPNDLQLHICDMNGREVQFTIASVGTASITINISTLANDTFIIMAETGDNLYSYKVLLSRVEE